MAKKIYIENNCDIEIEKDCVKVNGKKVAEDEKKAADSWEQVALKIRHSFLQNHLKRQYENTIVLTGAGSSFNI
ncbi:hypothetical protein, partial [Enterococcus faecium]|uniref:hypothetical protein n=1 Tax=Enterococcus faecium TaxID=1352 RepID=UPI0039FBB30B